VVRLLGVDDFELHHDPAEEIRGQRLVDRLEVGRQIEGDDVAPGVNASPATCGPESGRPLVPAVNALTSFMSLPALVNSSTATPLGGVPE
jgi:hypothetical protein